MGATTYSRHSQTMSTFINDSADMPLHEVIQKIQSRILTSTYFGIPTLKNPVDAWVYHEIIHEKKPTVIVEVGNYCGGSALMFAHWFDQIGHGKVIAVDINHQQIAAAAKDHPRITWIQGDGAESAELVRNLLLPEDRVMVIEDSSHHCEQCYSVLQSYHDMVTSGQYMIVEDSICNHGLPWIPLPGPYEAIEWFMRTNNDFEIDRSREDFLVTWNPRGFLLKR
jgi:cephalosporin hydroxylase